MTRSATDSTALATCTQGRSGPSGYSNQQLQITGTTRWCQPAPLQGTTSHSRRPGGFPGLPYRCAWPAGCFPAKIFLGLTASLQRAYSPGVPPIQKNLRFSVSKRAARGMSTLSRLERRHAPPPHPGGNGAHARAGNGCFARCSWGGQPCSPGSAGPAGFAQAALPTLLPNHGWPLQDTFRSGLKRPAGAGPPAPPGGRRAASPSVRRR